MRPFILIMAFHYVTCQIEDLFLPPVPEKCSANTGLLYKNCCIFPPFFTRQAAKECGSAVEMIFADKKNNVTGYRRNAFNGCTHWWCILDKYSLLTQYGDVDDEKYYAHLDLWVGLNPMFADAMLEAKVLCKQQIRNSLPLKVCNFWVLHGCIRNYLNVDCPVTIPTMECLELKAFYKECKQFYLRK